jgi:tetratricopeptide (TPR) repeat protein
MSVSNRSFPLALVLASLLALTFCQVLYGQDDAGNEGEAVALFNKGQDAHEKGDLKTAIEFYEKALKLIPEFPEAELQRGSALLTLGKVDDAEAAYRHAVELRADWSLALAQLGSLLVRRGKLDEAGPVLRKALDADPDNTPAWIGLASLKIRSKAAEQELRDIYKKIAAMSTAAKPTSALFAARASLENALNERRAASLSATKALEIDPKNIPMLALIATNAIADDDLAKANELIKRIEATEPNASELQSLKVRALVAAGKNDEAVKLVESIANPSPELAAIKSQLAMSSETDTAKLEKILETEPRNVAVLSRLCSLLRVKEPLRAMDFCRRASDAEPNKIEHAIGYGAAMLQAKQYLQAAGLFQKLMAATPENFTVRANLATALFQLKRYNEAKEQFTWLTERQPSNAAAYFFLAVAYDELGEYPDAMANYQLFLKHADSKMNQLEVDKVNLRLPILQRQLDAGKGRKNVKTKG